MAKFGILARSGVVVVFFCLCVFSDGRSECPLKGCGTSRGKFAQRAASRCRVHERFRDSTNGRPLVCKVCRKVRDECSRRNQ